MIAVIDCETTGTNVYSSEIITLFGIAVDKNLNELGTIDFRSQPLNWGHGAEQVHKITRQEASQYPLFKDCYIDLINWFKAYQVTEIWCHANPLMFGKITYFDYTLLRMQMSYQDDASYWLINSIRPYSTHTLASLHLELEKLDLKTICDNLGIQLKHHNAESDARAALEIMRRLPVNTEDIDKKLRGYDDTSNAIESDPIKPTKKRRTTKRVSVSL